MSFEKWAGTVSYLELLQSPLMFTTVLTIQAPMTQHLGQTADQDLTSFSKTPKIHSLGHINCYCIIAYIISCRAALLSITDHKMKLNLYVGLHRVLYWIRSQCCSSLIVPALSGLTGSLKLVRFSPDSQVLPSGLQSEGLSSGVCDPFISFQLTSSSPLPHLPQSRWEMYSKEQLPHFIDCG